MFVVDPDGHDSLLGDKAGEHLGLVKRVYCINNISAQHNAESIVDQYSDIFHGFGVLPFTNKRIMHNWSFLVLGTYQHLCEKS